MVGRAGLDAAADCRAGPDVVTALLSDSPTTDPSTTLLPDPPTTDSSTTLFLDPPTTLFPDPFTTLFLDPPTMPSAPELSQSAADLSTQ